MFLPLLIRTLDFRKLIKYYAVTGIFTLISFALILDLEVIQNLFISIDLYFQKFEFNASIFYILQAIGFQNYGYDVVQTLGPALSIIALLIILFLSLRKKIQIHNLPAQMLWIFLVYLLCATTVHPWYIIVLFSLSLFADKVFPLTWTLTAVMSYYAYSQPDWKESSLLIAFEYGIVLLVFALESGHLEKYGIRISKNIL